MIKTIKIETAKLINKKATNTTTGEEITIPTFVLEGTSPDDEQPKTYQAWISQNQLAYNLGIENSMCNDRLFQPARDEETGKKHCLFADIDYYDEGDVTKENIVISENFKRVKPFGVHIQNSNGFAYQSFDDKINRIIAAGNVWRKYADREPEELPTQLAAPTA